MALTAFDYRFVLTLLDNNSKEYNNVFYVKAQAGFQGNPNDLKIAFETTVMDAIGDVLHTSMQSARATVTKLDGTGAFWEGDLNFGGGQVAGDHMPDFVGFAYRIVRPSNLVRNGRKIFGRVSESDIADGTRVAGAVARLDALADAMAEPWEAVLAPATNYKICIPHSINVAEEGEDPVYELTSLIEATDVEYVRVSSQNSRKS